MHHTLVIGLRGRGKSWAKAVQAHPEFELTGLADIDPDTLAAAAAEFQIPPERRHSDHNTALASGAYEIAVVVVSHKFHYALTKDALLAGLHCLTEKPFTMDIGQAEELVKLAGEKKRVVEVVQNYRYTPASQFIAEAIRDQRLGRLATVEGSFHRFRPPHGEREADMPFPVLFTQSVHHLDWLVSVLPAAIDETISRHQRVPWSKWENPAICHILMRCADGVLVSYQASYDAQGEISSYDGIWRFAFEKGDLIVDNERQVWQVAEKGQKREIVLGPDAKGRSGDLCLLDDLHNAITTGAEPPTSGRDNLKTLKVLFGVMGEWRRSASVCSTA
ncbi:MAG: Gfo/Idh/MocA family oxidoreductase [Kiritimatiellae bacterium]|nr:Gfo/Idh/MocA family oxidoreductase [Kiritimatiellia bacterium]